MLALVTLCVLWEGWLDPVRPEGSWLTLKALPLLLALPGVLRGKRYTFQWLSLLVLLYVTEGLSRIFDPPPSAALAAAETVLALALFACVLGAVRSRRKRGD